jgi:putative membrane protein
VKSLKSKKAAGWLPAVRPSNPYFTNEVSGGAANGHANKNRPLENGRHETGQTPIIGQAEKFCKKTRFRSGYVLRERGSDMLGLMKRDFAATLLLASALTLQTAVVASPGQLNSDEKAFIDFAGQTDLVNVRLAQMAQLQASAPAVKRFAALLEQDHAADHKRLATIAKLTGTNAPKTLDEVHMNFVRRLNKLKGKSFDLTFLKTVVNEHENAYVPFRREADNGFNPSLKAYARRALPRLDSHLKQARRLAAAPE